MQLVKKSTKYDLPNISDNDPLRFGFTQHVSKFSALFDAIDIICSISFFFHPGDPIKSSPRRTNRESACTT